MEPNKISLGDSDLGTQRKTDALTEDLGPSDTDWENLHQREMKQYKIPL